MIYPRIESGQIFFSEDTKRDLKPLSIEGVTYNEFQWLASQTANLAYMPEQHPTEGSGSVAFRCEKMIYLNPLEVITAVFYDDLIKRIGGVRKILESYRQVQETRSSPLPKPK